MLKLETGFESRKACADYVAQLAPWVKQPASLHPFIATREVALAQLDDIDFINYGKTRNFLNGGVTRLSPYINAHMLTLNEVRNAAIASAHEAVQVGKFVQELGWRDFWQRIYEQHPEWLFTSIEPYKTGFAAEDYADTLPDDIIRAQTDCACINDCITQLYTNGYVHNHARMYLASYVIHWRKVSWQAGAKWMHHHLIDGNLASNNLSWQWVASTFGNKPYIFNLENVQKYADATLNVTPADNVALDASYEALYARLFPLMGKP